MATIQCRMCGGMVELSPGASSGECPYCGGLATFPQAADVRTEQLYNRAEHFRQICDFDRAAAAYEELVRHSDGDPDAYWGLVLSRFGIEYVEDPASGERIPTCHRAQFDSILADPDYQRALELSQGMQQELYESQAKRIAEIQKGILAISAKEEPYDIFLCYKEKTEGGSRTKESAIAQDLYYQLTQEGWKVFFARISLEDKLGQQYEPYIFAALNSARVMLVLGSRKEHFESPWVKNEWSRFLALMKKDRSRLLIPCYIGMDPYDLPEELSMLQSQDMAKIGFMQDLLHGIRKVLKKEKETERREEADDGDASPGEVAPLLKRCQIFLEDKEWERATEYANRVLDMDPENGEAYWMLLLAESCASSLAEMPQEKFQALSGDKNFSRAMRYADADLKAQMAQQGKEAEERWKREAQRARLLAILQNLLRRREAQKREEERQRAFQGRWEALLRGCSAAETPMDFLTLAPCFDQLHQDGYAPAEGTGKACREIACYVAGYQLGVEFTSLSMENNALFCYSSVFQEYRKNPKRKVSEEDGTECLRQAMQGMSVLLQAGCPEAEGCLEELRERCYGLALVARMNKKNLVAKSYLDLLPSDYRDVETLQISTANRFCCLGYLVFLLLLLLGVAGWFVFGFLSSMHERNQGMRNFEKAVAAHEYGRAVNLVSCRSRTEENRNIMIRRLLNAAQHALQEKQWEEAIAAANAILNTGLDAGNRKAWDIVQEARGNLVWQESDQLWAKKDYGEAMALLSMRLETEEARGAVLRRFLNAAQQAFQEERWEEVATGALSVLGLDARHVTARKLLAQSQEHFRKRYVLPGEVDLELVYIPAGAFLLEDREEGKGRMGKNETWVTLSQGYWLGKYEVTQEQWMAIMGENPSFHPAAQHPVESVSWENAMEFCRKLNEKYASLLPPGYAFTLPTEAEWEYACRAGGSAPYGGGGLDNVAWHAANVPLPQSQSVGKKQPNVLGLYDMQGNVAEWCLDCFEKMGISPMRDPVGSMVSSRYVHRGGSFQSGKERMKDPAGERETVTARDRGEAFLGLRLALCPRSFHILSVEGKEVLVQQGAVVSYAVPEKQGCSFLGWTLEGMEGVDLAGETLEFTMPGQDVKLTPNFQMNAYALTVDGVTEQVLYGSSVSRNAAPEKNGHAFLQWVGRGIALDHPKEAAQTFAMPDHDVTLTAVYAIPYVVVDLNSGEVRGSDAPPDLGKNTCRTTELWLRQIPRGTFLMGSPEEERGRSENEDLHPVTLTQDFYIGIFEVTQRQWELIGNTRPSYFSREGDYATRPVEQVSYAMIRGVDTTGGAGWPQAGHAVDENSFLGKLRAKTGLLFDLPTSAQWEYACRAETTTALNSGRDLKSTNFGPNMSEVGRYACTSFIARSSDTFLGTNRVGSYRPNAWGIYDMHGNVAEWCLDRGQYRLGTNPVTDPVGPEKGNVRVIRGGHWQDRASECRSASLSWAPPSPGTNTVGFRVVLVLP